MGSKHPRQARDQRSDTEQLEWMEVLRGGREWRAVHVVDGVTPEI